jgi:hypothetical protein
MERYGSRCLPATFSNERSATSMVDLQGMHALYSFEDETRRLDLRCSTTRPQQYPIVECAPKPLNAPIHQCRIALFIAIVSEH